MKSSYFNYTLYLETILFNYFLPLGFLFSPAGWRQCENQMACPVRTKLYCNDRTYSAYLDYKINNVVKNIVDSYQIF